MLFLLLSLCMHTCGVYTYVCVLTIHGYFANMLKLVMILLDNYAPLSHHMLGTPHGLGNGVIFILFESVCVGGGRWTAEHIYTYVCIYIILYITFNVVYKR